MIIDTHAHLYWDSFQENFDEYIQRAIDAGVSGVFNVGVDIKSSEKALEQIKDIATCHSRAPLRRSKYPWGESGNPEILHGSRVKHGMTDEKNLIFYSSIGIHPEEAIKYTSDKSRESRNKIENDIKTLEDIYKSNPDKVRLVGECGMDFLFREQIATSVASLLPRNDEVKALQKKLFQAQIDLAKKLNLPLSVHCRDDRSQNPNNTECWDEVIEMTKDHFGIYHCYSGLEATTKRVLEETRFLISFAGNLTYKNNKYLREAVKMIPLDRIVVETDCPFLPPQAHRGQQNEPSFITETVQCIADIKGMSVKEVARITSENALKLIRP